MGFYTAYAFNDPKQLGQIEDRRRTERIAARQEHEDPLIALFRRAGHEVKEG